MTTLIIIQLILAIALVILVLLQGSDNEGLGLGGGTFGGMMSARGSANLLSRLNSYNSNIIYGYECSTNNNCICWVREKCLRITSIYE